MIQNVQDQNFLSANVTIEDSLTSIRIAISYPPSKGLFTLELVFLVLRGCLTVPILGFTLLAVAWQFLPPLLAVGVSVLGVGLLYSSLYRAYRDNTQYLYDNEVIDIDNKAIKIKRFGSGFQNFVEYPADKIRAITLLFPDNSKFGWLRFLPGATSTNIDSFFISNGRGLKGIHTFGKGIQREDARKILNLIWQRYPQYED